MSSGWESGAERIADIQHYLEHPEPDQYETLELISIRNDLRYLLRELEYRADYIHQLGTMIDDLERDLSDAQKEAVRFRDALLKFERST